MTRKYTAEEKVTVAFLMLELEEGRTMILDEVEKHFARQLKDIDTALENFDLDRVDSYADEYANTILDAIFT